MSNDEGTTGNEGTRTQKDVKAQEQLNELTDKEVVALSKKLDALKQARGLTKDISDMSKLELENQIKINEILKKNADFLGDLSEKNRLNVDILASQAEQELRRLKDVGDLSKEEFELQKQRLKEIEEFGSSEKESLSDKFDILEDILEKLEEEVKIKNGSKLIDDAGLTIHKDIAKTLGIKVKAQDTLLGQVGMLGNLLSANKEKQGEILAGLKNQIKEAFHYRKIAASVFSAIYENSKELFTSFDKAQASLAGATGQGDAFRATLYEVGRQGNLFGVSMDEAGKAIGTLVDQTSNFTSMSKATQVSLALNTAKMEKLGVAASDSAAIFQNFNQALGITADESMRMQTELAMAGVSIGINASKITKDFNSALSTLMVYGRESVDVFKGIAAAAKAAGVETSTLLGIAAKFDTFAGAAEGAGKLNALLGTQLSTTEMLMATEDERIRMLVESVQSQGIAFKDMDRFTQKAIANAAGISDMAEANRIFGMSLDAYDENERKLKASADAQKKLDDAVAKTIPVMDQFKKLGAEIVVALEPFLTTLEKGAKVLTEWFKDKSTEEKEQIAFWTSLGAAFILVMPIFKGIIGLVKMMIPTLSAADKATKKSGKGFVKFGSRVGKALANVGKGLSRFSLGLIKAMAPVIVFVGAAALLASAIAAIGYAFSAVIDSAKGFYDLIYGTSDAESKVKEFEARAAEAMATIVSSNHEGALASIKAMVEEVNKMGQDVKVSSTIENLALITAGKASSMTGERVVANQTNVVANVQNFFEGMEITLNVDGEKMKGFVSKVVNGEV